MKKSLAVLFLASLTIAGITAFRPMPEATPLAQNPKVRTIILDPGHGGKAAGAKGKYSYEKDICLDVALKLGKRLEEAYPDAKILYTRTTDVFTDNRWRADFANKNGGDLYVSIHVNAMPPTKHTKFNGYKTETYYVKKGGKKVKKTRKVPKYNVYYTPNTRSGTETYIWAADRADEKGEFVGEQTYDSTEYVPNINDPEFKAKSLLWTKKYFDKSLLLASFVEEEFTNAGRSSNGVKQRTWEGIWVLQATAMPSILVETGFITNEDEENYLNSEKGQNEVADNVFNAIKRYKQQLENKNALGKNTPKAKTNSAISKK